MVSRIMGWVDPDSLDATNIWSRQPSSVYRAACISRRFRCLSLHLSSTECFLCRDCSAARCSRICGLDHAGCFFVSVAAKRKYCFAPGMGAACRRSSRGPGPNQGRNSANGVELVLSAHRFICCRSRHPVYGVGGKTRMVSVGPRRGDRSHFDLLACPCRTRVRRSLR